MRHSTLGWSANPGNIPDRFLLRAHGQKNPGESWHEGMMQSTNVIDTYPVRACAIDEVSDCRGRPHQPGYRCPSATCRPPRPRTCGRLQNEAQATQQRSPAEGPRRGPSGPILWPRQGTRCRWRPARPPFPLKVLEEYKANGTDRQRKRMVTRNKWRLSWRAGRGRPLRLQYIKSTC